MTVYDLEILISERIESGEFGDVEMVGFLNGKIENPFQLIVRDRKSLISKLIDICRDDGSDLPLRKSSPCPQWSTNAEMEAAKKWVPRKETPPAPDPYLDYMSP